MTELSTVAGFIKYVDPSDETKSSHYKRIGQLQDGSSGLKIEGITGCLGNHFK